MSKTKEEIIEEYIPCTCGEIYTSRKMVAPDCPRHAFAVEEAMDEYAKQQVIDTLDWMYAGATETIPPGDQLPSDRHMWLRDLSDLYKKSEDLYVAFLQSQSQ